MKIAVQTAECMPGPVFSMDSTNRKDIVRISLDLFSRLRRGELPIDRTIRERPVGRHRRSAASRSKLGAGLFPSPDDNAKPRQEPYPCEI